MRTVDAAPFYDLPEAGRLLWADPARLTREAVLRSLPAARTADGWALPKAWVDAQAGLEPADAEALKTYWLTRLAPPSLAARKAVRPRHRLPAPALLSADETARRLFCDRPRLERLSAEGTLPALRVDDQVVFDAALVEALVAEEALGPAGGPAASARRAQVLPWTQADYTTDDALGLPARAPVREGLPPPGAYRLPDDLVERAAPEGAPASAPRPTRSTDLSRAEGFETVDED